MREFRLAQACPTLSWISKELLHWLIRLVMLSEKWEDFKAMKMVLNIIYIMVIFSTNLILWFLFLPDLLS